jgi:hypothetical protein
VPQPSGPPVLYIDPGTLFSYQPGPELARSGVYNSGVMLPGPGTGYTLVIGDMTPGPEPYLCLLHDESGMKGTLVVAPRSGGSDTSGVIRSGGIESTLAVPPRSGLGQLAGPTK